MNYTKCLALALFVALAGILFAGWSAFPVLAEDENAGTLRVVTPDWPEFANKDGSGLYLDIFKQMYEPLGVTVSVKFVPFERAMENIREKKADVMFGLYSVEVSGFDFLWTPRYALETERVVAVFKKGLIPQWEGEKSLENQTVTFMRGYDYDLFLNVKIQKQEIDNPEQPWLLLEKGRDDFYLEEFNSLKAYIRDHQVDMSGYQVETVYEHYLYPGFAQTPQCEKFMAIYEQRIPEMVADGTLDAIYKKWEKEFPITSVQQK
jgi:polar amino acid transport system substrate-binding protein